MNATDRVNCLIKLRPTRTQERQLARWLFHLTGVYNWTIRKLELDARDGIYHSLYDMKALIAWHSKRVGVPGQFMGGTVRTAFVAWQRYRRGISRKPHLKGVRNRLNSIPNDHGEIQVSDRRVRLAGGVLVRFHRQDIPVGRITCYRLIKRASGWYCCLTIAAAPRSIVAGAGEVGIDPGFTSLLTLSTGEKVEHPHEWQQTAARLGQAQRGQRKHLTARLHERLGNQRQNRNHHLSRQLVEANQLIVFSADRHSNIARTFGKSVSSAGHYQLRQMLAYKSRLGGGSYVEVSNRNSTRRCSACQALTGPTGWQGLKVRRWVCTACGVEHGRDSNAAMNTLIAGRGMRLENSRKAVSGIAS